MQDPSEGLFARGLGARGKFAFAAISFFVGKVQEKGVLKMRHVMSVRIPLRVVDFMYICLSLRDSMDILSPLRLFMSVIIL